jgi:beta-glucosidase
MPTPDAMTQTPAADERPGPAAVAVPGAEPAGPDDAREFPRDFRWGVATAAYQIEGAANEDGRGQSIWDTFCRVPGKVYNGHTGDVACDHYHRYRHDVALMRELTVGTYRFSVSWPRIVPDGTGPTNTRGLDFYDGLVDTLLEAGINPMLTLYHWDLPQALEDRGGWVNRATAHHFAEYAAVVHARLGDRVRTWTTLNEPWCSAFLGYGNGEHAPGRSDPAEAFRATHHLLLAHGLAVSALRSAGARELSITLNLCQLSPEDPTDPHDLEAVRIIDGLQNRVFLDPILRRSYPDDVQEIIERHGGLDHQRPGDLATIGGPIDLLGVNYYAPAVVAARVGATTAGAKYPGSEGVVFVDQARPKTAMGWPIHADGLVEQLARLHRDYPGVPLMVTENGAAFDDEVVDGQVVDTARIDYLRAHLDAARRAIASGVDLRGYIAWSLLDNFEWAHGYTKRFGLVHVDYATQRRTPKHSALWYRDVIGRRAVPLWSSRPTALRD